MADRSSALERGGAIDLWERAGGSPFWLDLLVRTQGDERDFETVVAARTRGLDPDAAALLRVLAILGRPIDAGRARGTHGMADGTDHRRVG